MGPLDEIQTLARKKAALRERARELQVRVGEIEPKKRLPQVALHALTNLWHPIAFEISGAAHQLRLQVDDTWIKEGLQVLEKKEQTIDISDDQIRTFCNFDQFEQADQEAFFPILKAKLEGEMSYRNFVRHFNELYRQFEHEVEDVEKECIPLRESSLEIDAEVAGIDRRLKEIADAATIVISG